MGINCRLIKKCEKREWVLMLHGFGGSSNIWFKQVRDLSKEFNLIMVDIPGHGGSKYSIEGKDINKISQDILDKLTELSIHSFHIVSVSLGTVISQVIYQISPERVKSQVKAGAVVKMDTMLRIVYKMLTPLVYILPYKLTYRIAAHIILPFKSHKESRDKFISEAGNLNRKDFINWYKMFSQINHINSGVTDDIKELYIMGSEDYIFLNILKSVVKHNQIVIIDKCGHICNIEKYEEFNNILLKYLVEK